MSAINLRRRLSVGEAAEYTGVSERSLRRLRKQGNGPRFIRVSARKFVYDSIDLDSWMNSNKRRRVAK